jgi:hypothetical protein
LEGNTFQNEKKVLLISKRDPPKIGNVFGHLNKTDCADRENLAHVPQKWSNLSSGRVGHVILEQLQRFGTESDSVFDVSGRDGLIGRVGG